jgi:hypothetical protein
VVPELGSDLSNARYVDMRYPNGFAVCCREGPDSAPDSTQVRLAADG